MSHPAKSRFLQSLNSKDSQSPWKLATAALFIILGWVILQTFGDYGMSWDEYYRQNEGAKKFEYYQNLFSGQWEPYDSKEDLYPGFYDILHQAAIRVLPFGPIFTDHLLTAIVGLLTILAAWKIGVRLGNYRAGFFSALFLALFPHFYGHMFINPKDIPFACGYLWSLYFTLKLIDTPRLDATLIAKIAIVYGLTLGVRLGGVFFFAFMALAFALRLFLGRTKAHLWRTTLQYAGLGLLIVIISFLILLLWWPMAHSDPLGTIFHGLNRVASYPWNGPVLLNGHIYPATDLPWYYLPEMLLITTPELILFLGGIGILITLFSLAKRLPQTRLSYFTPRRLQIFLVAFAFIFPIIAVIAKHATLYDGIRHFLFILGPWAILAALALEKLLQLQGEHFKNRSRADLRLANILATGIILLPCVMIVQRYTLMHPYQYVYFNSFVGGESKAYVNFDTEYWGTSHREAVELLAKHLSTNNDHKVYKVTSPMAPWLVENFLPANLVYTLDPREADFFISFLRFNAYMWSDGEIMKDCVVVRGDVPLAIVRDRRKIRLEQAQAVQKGHTNNRIISGILEMLPL